GWLRLAGGKRAGSSLAYLTDPRPERWGRRDAAGVLRAFSSKPEGLTTAEAARRRRPRPVAARRHELLAALRNQLRPPITAVLAGGAGLALVVGEFLNASIIGATIAVNVAAGVWQERQIGRAAEALHRLGSATARVLRDGEVVTLPAAAVVPGDVLVLA